MNREHRDDLVTRTAWSVSRPQPSLNRHFLFLYIHANSR